jgi:hypothetical protein
MPSLLNRTPTYVKMKILVNTGKKKLLLIGWKLQVLQTHKTFHPTLELKLFKQNEALLAVTCLRKYTR